jgi:hypothetical protein
VKTQNTHYIMCGYFGNIFILYSEFLLTLTGVFLTLTEVFPCFFLSSKANARVKLVKTWHSPHSSKLVVMCVVPLLFVLFVCKCVLCYCHRVTTQLQLTNISYHDIKLKIKTQTCNHAPFGFRIHCSSVETKEHNKHRIILVIGVRK